MIPGALARRYARALIGLAPTPQARDKYAQDMDTLSDIVRQPDAEGIPVLSVLTAERFGLQQRSGLLKAVSRRIGADPMVVKFLDYVLERGRIVGLPDIARAYRLMADQAAGRLQAEVTSARALPPDAVTRIKGALEKATGKQIVLSTKVDAELIGGVVTRVGSFVLDGSVRSSLAGLRAELQQR